MPTKLVGVLSCFAAPRSRMGRGLWSSSHATLCCTTVCNPFLTASGLPSAGMNLCRQEKGNQTTRRCPQTYLVSSHHAPCAVLSALTPPQGFRGLLKGAVYEIPVCQVSYYVYLLGSFWNLVLLSAFHSSIPYLP